MKGRCSVYYRDGYYEKAINSCSKSLQRRVQILTLRQAWLLQQAARVANRWGNEEISLKSSKEAYALNHI